MHVPDGQLGRFYTALGECWLRAEHEARNGDGGDEDQAYWIDEAVAGLFRPVREG